LSKRLDFSCGINDGVNDTPENTSDRSPLLVARGVQLPATYEVGQNIQNIQGSDGYNFSPVVYDPATYESFLYLMTDGGITIPFEDADAWKDELDTTVFMGVNYGALDNS
jgi:hypothetical protein